MLVANKRENINGFVWETVKSGQSACVEKDFNYYGKASVVYYSSWNTLTFDTYIDSLRDLNLAIIKTLDILN